MMRWKYRTTWLIYLLPSQDTQSCFRFRQSLDHWKNRWSWTSLLHFRKLEMEELVQYDYMPELKKDIISALPTIMQESSFWWEYCSEYWRNCSLSLWMETSQRQELGQTLSLRTVLKTWSVKNQKTSRSFWRDEALFARRQVGSGHGNQEVLSLARAAFPLAPSREFDWIKSIVSAQFCWKWSGSEIFRNTWLNNMTK